jgi:V/A-type H+-transporting ATPase subunit I
MYGVRYMWVPEEMTHFLLAAAEEDLPLVLDFIGKEGKFHIVEFSSGYLREPEYTETYRRLEDYSKRIKDIIEYFAIKSDKEIPLSAVEINKVAEEGENFLKQFQEKLGEKQSRLESLKKEEMQLNLTSELLTLLPESDTPIEELRNSRFLRMMGGTIPSSEEKNLLEIAKERDILVFRRKSQGGIMPLIMFYSSFELESLGKILESVHFGELEFFSRLEGPILSLKDKIEGNFWEIKEERTALVASLKKMGRNIEDKILQLKNDIRVSILELEWLKKTARSDKVFFISTYLPSRSVSSIKKKGEKLNLYILGEENIKRKSENAGRTPTKLSNPSVLRPFESIVKAYGIPSYGGVDPTIFTSLSFVLFFGIMFGDLGHGLILISAGIALYWVRLLRKFAIFPLMLGISSAIFGTIFGEFFGTHPFEPIWFSPFREPQKAMLFAVYLGIIIVTSGFVLRLIEYTMENDKERLFLSGHGLPGFIFYLSSLSLVFSVINENPGKIIMIEAIVIGVSALVVVVGIPLRDALKEGLNSSKLLISLGDLVHLSLSMISNTLSFIRIAAFNIGHVILTMSLIEISNLIGKMIGVGGSTTLIFGNIAIIGLEGMIVFIQGLRLEYYEFYSRFFERGKEIYQPVKIK